MTRTRCLLAGLACALLGIAPAAVAQPPPAAATCGACHGAKGAGQEAAGFPRLAGLDATYLLRQLDGFADGTRASPVMTPVAKALDANERHALAGYYASLPVPAAPQAARAPAASGLGAQLALRGRWQQDVPGCVACHGPRGVGVGAGFPPLAGQPASYLVAQLRAFQSRTRHNDPLGLMRHVAAGLDAQDMAAVSAWFAAQSAAPHGELP